MRGYGLILGCFLGGLLWLGAAGAAELFPFEDVKAGQRGTGRTVFSGNEIAEFEVEILGVLENVWPGQSLILGRLAGGPLEKTGVMAGMSGSPVYIEGRLAGAIAYSFPFSTEPIAGIRPIHEMLRGTERAEASKRARVRGGVIPFPEGGLGDGLAIRERLVLAGMTDLLPGDLLPVGAFPAGVGSAGMGPLGPLPAGGEAGMIPIATPAGLAGFSEGAFEVFGSQLRSLGLRPAQGVGGRGRVDGERDQKPLEAGAMINVALIQGDMVLSAAGTVTYIDGETIYAFGHRFLSSGPTQMPFLRSSVIAVVPNLNNSFKISASGEPLGVMDRDRSTGISGRLGGKADMLPLDITLRSGGDEKQYRMKLVNDRSLSAFLLQMALFSAVDTTQRQIGASSYRVSGWVDLGSGVTPLRLDNMFSGSTGVPLQLATATAIPLAYLMESDLETLSPRRITLRIEAIDEEKSLEVDRGWAERTRVRPGEELELAAALRDPKGAEQIHRVRFPVPPGLAPGPLEISFSDGQTLNALDWRTFREPRRARDLNHLVRAMNRLRRNDRLYVRIWRPSRGFLLHTERLPAPPSSVAGLLSSPGAAAAGVVSDWRTTLAEYEIDGLGSVVRGSVNLKVSVVE